MDIEATTPTTMPVVVATTSVCTEPITTPTIKPTTVPTTMLNTMPKTAMCSLAVSATRPWLALPALRVLCKSLFHANFIWKKAIATAKSGPMTIVMPTSSQVLSS